MRGSSPVDGIGAGVSAGGLGDMVLFTYGPQRNRSGVPSGWVFPLFPERMDERALQTCDMGHISTGSAPMRLDGERPDASPTGGCPIPRHLGRTEGKFDAMCR